MKSSPPTTGFPPDLFDATRWSVVVDAADSGLGTASHRALSELCRTYWFPVYVYLRRYRYQACSHHSCLSGRCDTAPTIPVLTNKHLSLC
jgi:hypothetical protein